MINPLSGPGVMILAYALALTALGTTKRSRSLARSTGAVLIVVASLNLAVEHRPSVFASAQWGVAAFLAVLFGAAYTYLFVSLLHRLGITRRAIWLSGMPLIYVALAAFGLAGLPAKGMDNTPLVLFGFLDFICAIQLAVFAYIASNLSPKDGQSPRPPQCPPAQDLADLHWSFGGVILLVLSLAVRQVLVRGQWALLSLDFVILSILAISLILVAKGRKQAANFSL